MGKTTLSKNKKKIIWFQWREDGQHGRRGRNVIRGARKGVKSEHERARIRPPWTVAKPAWVHLRRRWTATSPVRVSVHREFIIHDNPLPNRDFQTRKKHHGSLTLIRRPFYSEDRLSCTDSLLLSSISNPVAEKDRPVLPVVRSWTF